MVYNITIADLLKIAHKVKIIDIRSIESFNNNHIPNAHNIPYDKLLIEPSKYLDKYETYYIYCQKGVRSVEMVKYLKKKGYHAINILGGYESYILEN